MRKPPSLGEFEQIVLLAVLRLGEDAYGVTIRAEIAACAGRVPAPGALYTTLDRLEEKGILRSRVGEATPQRGGRAKRYFALTKNGLAALVNAQRAYQSLLEGLDLLGGAHACIVLG
jgi:PadR family transcriptional regulator, regulatory protein PadR